MNEDKARQLIDKYLNGTCTPAEKALLERFYLKESIKRDLSANDPIDWDLEKIEIWNQIQDSTTGARPVIKLRIWRRISTVAAILIIALSCCLFFYLDKSVKTQLITNSNPKPDIAPGSNKAVLTLANGSKITLKNAANGKIAEQAGIIISKTKNGQLVYSVSDQKINTRNPLYNSISIPRGGQYEVVLPDGTRVWLNAASSLRYPTRFSNSQRKVELEGEAYFEVAKAWSDKRKIANIPFLVVTSKQTVEVLGTHFNINAYKDESAVKTTLLEGSVRVSGNRSDQSKILKPGEQSVLNINNNSININKVNIASAIAWKNGAFQFQNSDISSVMRQLSRWYDVEVEFKGEIPDLKLWGEVYRDVNASQALEVLSYFDLKYKIEQTGNAKKIIITQ